MIMQNLLVLTSAVTPTWHIAIGVAVCFFLLRCLDFIMIFLICET